MSGHFDRYWEMKEGGPYDEEGESNEIFKCTDCGAETHHAKGYNGEPDTGGCNSECPSRASDWRPGRVSAAFRHNLGFVAFDKKTPLADAGPAVAEVTQQEKRYKGNFGNIFPNSPGAGI